MAKRFDGGPTRNSGVADPQLLLSAIESFIAGCKRPAAIDFGDEPIDILPGKHALQISSGRLTIDVWDESRNLSRRLTAVTAAKPGILECSVQRFGGVIGKLTLIDLERPQAAARAIKGSRQSFAEQFRRMLTRQHPGWEIVALTSAPDLRRSLSALFPRAHLQYGHRHIAALACPSAEDEPALLACALLWYDYLRSRPGVQGQVTLCLFLPAAAGNITAQRLRWLTGRDLRVSLFLFNEHGMAGEVDPLDLGNLSTCVAAQYARPDVPAQWKPVLTQVLRTPGISCCPEIGGALSVRFRGLEFARLERGRMFLGIEAQEEIAPECSLRVEEFVRHLASFAPASTRSAQPSLPAFPERWLEASVRSDLQQLDPELLSEPVHGQVLTFAGGNRECLDLLAVSRAGRLTVIELKASEDLQLPVQALDYWMRIKWHAERSELDHLFPGISLQKHSPKLLLIAPAFSFHPTNQIVLRYFAPEIEVERIGVHSEWQSSLAVAYRLRGAELPISHQRQR